MYVMRLVLAVAALAAFSAIAIGPAAASESSYTCSYRSPQVGQVTITLSGSQNNAYFCQIFSSAFGGRRVYWHGGSPRCAWISRSLDIRVTVYSSSSLYGRLFCEILAPRVKHEFIRLY